ncbi:MAG: hypothetical protein HKN03_12115 [Acidimicrobiales bacterium]|nr:hypothetical protein [Acidimicrobiales bacterium]
MKERGTTLTGYALTVALFTLVALGSVKALEDNGETFLEGTGQEIGAPRGESDKLAVDQLAHIAPGPNSLGDTTHGAAAKAAAAAPSSGPPTQYIASTGTSAVVNMDTTGYAPAGDPLSPSTATAEAPRARIWLTPPTTGSYSVEIEILASASGSQSIFVDIGSGLQLFNTPSNVTSSVWHGGSLTVSLTADDPFELVVYPREAGVVIGSVRLVPVP